MSVKCDCEWCLGGIQGGEVVCGRIKSNVKKEKKCLWGGDLADYSQDCAIADGRLLCNCVFWCSCHHLTVKITCPVL